MNCSETIHQLDRYAKFIFYQPDGKKNRSRRSWHRSELWHKSIQLSNVSLDGVVLATKQRDKSLSRIINRYTCPGIDQIC